MLAKVATTHEMLLKQTANSRKNGRSHPHHTATYRNTYMLDMYEYTSMTLFYIHPKQERKLVKKNK